MVEKLSVTKNIKELMELYGIPGEIVMCLRTEGGHINDTYYVVALSPIGTRRECAAARRPVLSFRKRKLQNSKNV